MCASHPSLLVQRTHEFSYDTLDSVTTLDGFKMPKNKMARPYNDDADDDGDAADGSNEKQKEKANAELEQQLLREDVLKAPFAHLLLSTGFF